MKYACTIRATLFVEVDAKDEADAMRQAECTDLGDCEVGSFICTCAEEEE